jgi:hypothetical protein
MRVAAACARTSCPGYERSDIARHCCYLGYIGKSCGWRARTA